MIGQAVVVGLLFACTAGEVTAADYCQQTVGDVDCNTKVTLTAEPDDSHPTSTHLLPCLFNSIPSSGWQFQFMKNVTYKELCHTAYDSSVTLRKLISSHYSYKMSMEGFPVVWCYTSEQCSGDLALGCQNRDTSALDCAKINDDWDIPTSVYLFNHLHFKVGCRPLHRRKLIWKIESVQLVLVSCSAPPCSPPSHPEGLLLPRKHDTTLDLKLSYSIEFVDVSMRELPPELQSEPLWGLALLVLAVTYMLYWGSRLKKRSAHWPKAAQVIDGEFSPPQHDVILSVLVSSGGRLVMTATAVLLARWLNVLPTIQMGFSEPVGLVLYTIVQSSLGGSMSGYVCRVAMGKSAAEHMTVLVLSFIPSTAAMFICISYQLAIFSMASFWAMLLFFVLLWAGVDLPLSLWRLHYWCAQVRPVKPAAVHNVQYPSSFWGQIIFAGGSLAPFLCILPQLGPILDYLQGINTLTFNFGYALLHFVGMLVASGLYGFIVASGDCANWYWKSFFANKYSSLLQLVYVLCFSKVYTGHVLLFVNWTMVMTFGFFLMSGAVGYLCAALGLTSTT